MATKNTKIEKIEHSVEHIFAKLKGVKIPDRNIMGKKYDRIFDNTVKRLYKIIAGQECPKSVKVI